MFGIYVQVPGASGWEAVVSAVLVLAILGALPLLNARRGKTLAIALAVVGLVLTGLTVAQAFPMTCTPMWKWAGLC